MFGMLDYRAHKLLWLLRLPLRLVARIAFFLNVALSVAIAEWTQYPLPLKILVGYVAFEAIGILMLILLKIVDWIIQRIFFWLVDVVPTRGENAEEA